MELFRYSSDVYGQRVLEGISWDLFWVVVGISAISIIVHVIVKLLLEKKKAAES